MVLPIIGYGSPVLRNKTQDITPDYPQLSTIIENMFNTMYNANGVGLAAPQVGLSLRLFVIDCSPMDGTIKGDTSTEKEPKMVFINPEKIEEIGEEWAFEEGCLSIPDVRELVMRKPIITLRYRDAAFNEKTETFDGIKARVIQHEYDHLEGVLFTDKISLLRKQLVKPRLVKIAAGLVHADYPMRFAKRK
jgi:peptide deformylase